MTDQFSTKIPENALTPLLEIGAQIGFDPTSSTEAEDFFVDLIRQFTGPDDNLKDWLQKQLADRFKCVDTKPDWIQNPSWPFTPTGPMMFMGQINVPPGLFHDEASGHFV